MNEPPPSPEFTLHPFISTNHLRVLRLHIVHDDVAGPKSRIRSKTPMTMYSRALLTFHHILSSRKKDAIRSVAKDMDIVGICKVGYPGILAIEGEDFCVKRYIREIKVCRVYPEHVIRQLNCSLVIAMAILFLGQYDEWSAFERLTYDHRRCSSRYKDDRKDERGWPVHA